VHTVSRAAPTQTSAYSFDQGSFGKAGSADAHSIYMDDNRYVWVMDRTASKMVKYDVRLKPDTTSVLKPLLETAGGVESVDSDSSLRVSVAPPHTYGAAGSRRTERDIG
jgi:hypothetical protein